MGFTWSVAGVLNHFLMMVVALCFFQSYKIEVRSLIRYFKRPPRYGTAVHESIVIYALWAAFVCHCAAAVVVYTFSFSRLGAGEVAVAALYVALAGGVSVAWFLPLKIWRGCGVEEYEEEDTEGLRFSEMLACSRSGAGFVEKNGKKKWVEVEEYVYSGEKRQFGVAFV